VKALSESLFLVWGPPSHGPRSKVFARELGIPIEFVEGTAARGWAAGLIKYPVQAIRTVFLLRRVRPRLVIVQSPPSFAPMILAVWTLFGANRRFIIDAHSDAMQAWYWTRPRWLHRAVARRASATIVTNQTFADEIRGWGAEAMILRDIPTRFPIGAAPQLPDGFSVMVVNTFADDEPLDDIVEAASGLPDVRFFVTGNQNRARIPAESLPPNVAYTGFLADPDYYSLMGSVGAVMCLTTRDDTMQRGACEALSMGRPIITSNWPLLTDYFHRGTIHVSASAADIRAGVLRMRDDHSRLQQEIGLLQEEQQKMWEDARAHLARLLAVGS
jgi:glycosyltransferase involved in cell wall biosynthesis